MIAAAVEAKRQAGHQVLVVCSALSGISDSLEELARLAPRSEFSEVLDQIEQRHRDLARALGVEDTLLEGEFEQLRRLATGINLTGECTSRVRAQILSTGELMSTRLGSRYLETTHWLDARTALKAIEQPGQRYDQSYLAASCDFRPDPQLQRRLESHPAVLTQGFIATNKDGETVLLGRGGSDTSAAYLAAKLEAVELEIWTDVAGMYTADPRRLPTARLLKRLDYEEAQELATVGAKVLHPRCLGPCRENRIPIKIRCTQSPKLEGTHIEPGSGPTRAAVKAVSSKKGVVVVSMDSLGMWQQVGVLAELFGCFKRLGLSVDLITTSETNVTVTLDENAAAIGKKTLEDLLTELRAHCKPTLVSPCATVSLVGTRIRSLLPRLAPALEVFEDEKVHMICQSARDLNLTFVVDDGQADRLVTRLHSLLFSGLAEDETIGQTWQQQRGESPSKPQPIQSRWWADCRERLLEIAAEQSPVYVYDRETLKARAQSLLTLEAVDRVFYAIKANPNPEILRLFRELGLGFECVSPGELVHLARLFPDLEGGELLYTPNFASRQDYEIGFEMGAQVTLDNLEPLESWPHLFEAREIFLRMDPGKGGGHHRHVRTAGPLSKFGISVDQVPRLKDQLSQVGAKVKGLHAHSGSGIHDPRMWVRVAHYLAGVARDFPEVEVLDLGGGLGVSERPGQRGIDPTLMGEAMEAVRSDYPNYKLWLEPGRYLVSEAGVLLTTVNQTKRKGSKAFVGVDTGMNSLIRPALYGAFHQIVNLTRLDQSRTLLADVVGPICETGDVLGHDRQLPHTSPGDVLLVGTAGAYGRAMSSNYNLRSPAGEVLLDR